MLVRIVFEAERGEKAKTHTGSLFLKPAGYVGAHWIRKTFVLFSAAEPEGKGC